VEPEVKPLRLTTMLVDLATERAGGSTTLGEVVDRAAHRGFGFAIGFLAVVSIPFVGLSTPFGLAISFMAAQMLFGKERPWMPKLLRRRVVSADTLARLGTRLRRWTVRLERIVKPRWSPLLRGPLWPLCGLGIVLLGIGLALPLPIPGSNAIFIAPIIIYAIGVLEDDGALVFVGHIATVVHVFLAILFWVVVRDAVVHVWHWLHAAFG
jgi:hypothetical protein